jgi:hypothetical protein
VPGAQFGFVAVRVEFDSGPLAGVMRAAKKLEVKAR